jgi:hypothetical protein
MGNSLKLISENTFKKNPNNILNSKQIFKNIIIKSSLKFYFLKKIVSLARLVDSHATYKAVCDNFSIDLNEVLNIFSYPPPLITTYLIFINVLTNIYLYIF